MSKTQEDPDTVKLELDVTKLIEKMFNSEDFMGRDAYEVKCQLFEKIGSAVRRAAYDIDPRFDDRQLQSAVAEVEDQIRKQCGGDDAEYLDFSFVRRVV
jgi:hypothetical protein